MPIFFKYFAVNFKRKIDFCKNVNSCLNFLNLVVNSAAQFFAFFAKTKDGRAKDFSRKMTCEKFAKKCL